MQRVSVVGNSGSGKSTLAARIAQRLDAPHIELDALRHGPAWRETPDAEFRAAVAERLGAPRWVVDGNYPVVRDLVWARADTVVWLDRPRSVVMRRLVARTLRRLLLRQSLWNGNRERWTNILSRDPRQSVIAWAWTEHDRYRETYRRAALELTGIRWLRIRDDRDAARLLAHALEI